MCQTLTPEPQKREVINLYISEGLSSTKNGVRDTETERKPPEQ